MVKIKASKSKRMSSKQRHKIDRKKREHKRDLRKAAKSLKAKGLGPHRSKKSREMAQLAMKVSNAHPDKEAILSRVLQARENARVEKATRRSRQADPNNNDNEEGQANSVPQVSNKRQLLYISVNDSNNFKTQFSRSLSELVFPADQSSENLLEVPSAAYLVTLDSRFAVQCIPWTLLDAIVDQGSQYKGGRKALVLIVLTKMDLVSAPALVTQISLVAHALNERYPKGLGSNIVATITPFSVHFDKTGRHLLRILNQFHASEGCHSKKIRSNLDNKICSFVIGFPNTGRHSLCRALASEANESSVSAVPLRAAQLQLVRTGAADSEEEAQVHVKFAFPNAKSVTLIQFPEDAELRTELRSVAGGDVMFRSLAFIEKTLEPEAIGCVLFQNAMDKISLAQAFCQPAVTVPDDAAEHQSLKAAESFLRELGRTVRREKGFHVSPLFAYNAGTMGKTSSSALTANVQFTSGQQRSQTTLLDATYSNATPSKLVRISTVVTPSRKNRKSNPMVDRADAHNLLRLGARTFVRELCQGRNVPWAVMRAPGKKVLTPAQVAKASELFNLSITNGKKLGGTEELREEEHLNALMGHLSSLLKDILAILPNGVVEMDPDGIAAPQYNLEEAIIEESPEEDEDEDDENDDDDDEEEEGEEEEEDYGDADDDDDEDAEEEEEDSDDEEDE